MTTAIALQHVVAVCLGFLVLSGACHNRPGDRQRDRRPIQVETVPSRPDGEADAAADRTVPDVVQDVVLADIRGERPETAPPDDPCRRYETIVDNLLDDDPFLRKEAAKSLVRLGPEAGLAAPLLVQALKDPSERVRRYASTALWGMGAWSIEPRIEALSDPDPNFRLRIAQGLVWWCSMIEIDDVCMVMERILADRSPTVRHGLLAAVAGHEDLFDRLEEYPETRQAFGEEAMRALATGRRDPVLAALATLRFVALPTTPLFDAVRPLLSHADRDIALEAVSTLATVCWRDCSLDALDDDDAVVEARRLCNAGLVPRLLHKAMSGHPVRKIAVVRALARFLTCHAAHEEALAYVERVAKDPDASVRLATVETIGEFYTSLPDRAQAVLEQAVRDNSPGVREAARHRLGD